MPHIASHKNVINFDYTRMLSLSVAVMIMLATSYAFMGVISRKALSSQSLSMSTIYDIVEKDATGKDVPFSQFKGKVVYGVNVASKCGYTASGYALISKLAELKDQGVEVAIFPCNQFGGLFILRY